MQIGFKALEARFGIMPVQPLRVASVIGTARAMRESPRLSRTSIRLFTGRPIPLQGTSSSG